MNQTEGKPEALRLAEFLDREATFEGWLGSNEAKEFAAAVALLRSQHAEIERLRGSSKVFAESWSESIEQRRKSVERIHQQEAEIERLRADAWVPVSERLPPAGDLVLVSSNGALSVMSRDDGDDEGWCWVQQKWAWNLGDPEGLELDDDYEPTHWRPLPAPPALAADAGQAGGEKA